jgi:hypothetical protein
MPSDDKSSHCLWQGELKKWPISDITWLNQLNRAKRPDHSKTYDIMTATTCFMEFIFLTGREKPIDESDVDNDGEIDSESTGIGNSINNKVWGHLKDRWATIKVFFFFL